MNSGLDNSPKAKCPAGEEYDLDCNIDFQSNQKLTQPRQSQRTKQHMVQGSGSTPSKQIQSQPQFMLPPAFVPKSSHQVMSSNGQRNSNSNVPRALVGQQSSRPHTCRWSPATVRRTTTGRTPGLRSVHSAGRRPTSARCRCSRCPGKMRPRPEKMGKCLAAARAADRQRHRSST